VKWPFDHFRGALIKTATGGIEKEAKRQVLMINLKTAKQIGFRKRCSQERTE
jgi:hypothetical protein